MDAFRQGKRIGEGARRAIVHERTKEGTTIVVFGAGNTLGIEQQFNAYVRNDHVPALFLLLLV